MKIAILIVLAIVAIVFAQTYVIGPWLRQRRADRSDGPLFDPASPLRVPGQRDHGEVASPFTLDTSGRRATGKVLLHGELWGAQCSPELAMRLSMGTVVRIAYGEGLSVEVLETDETA